VSENFVSGSALAAGTYRKARGESAGGYRPIRSPIEVHDQL